MRSPGKNAARSSRAGVSSAPARPAAPQLSTLPDDVNVEDGIEFRTRKKAATAKPRPHPLKKVNLSFVLIEKLPQPHPIPPSMSSLFSAVASSSVENIDTNLVGREKKKAAIRVDR